MTERQFSAPSKPSSRRIAFGAGAIGVVSIVKMLLQVLALPVMARLLGPSEFGLYAVAMPAVAFAGMLADGGLGVSLVKEPDSSPIWSTAFWALLGIGIILAAGLSGLGFVMGGGISPATLATNNGGVIRNRGADNDDGSAFARLDREGRIAVGAGADLVGNILGVGFGVWLALRGAGAWSLVGQNVAIFLIRAAVINAVAFKMPVLEFHPSRLLAHFAVGGLMLGVRICDFGGRIIESMYLVHAFGTAKLGLYVFSNQVPRFISGAVSNPLWLSLYVRALREDGATTIALLRQFSRLLCMILFPVTALFLATGHILVPVFLGPKWAYAIPLLQILLPAYVLNALGSQCGAVLLAYNRYEIQLHCTIALTVGRVLVVCLGPWIGLISIAYGVLGVNAVYAAMMMIRSAAITGSTLVPLIRGLIGPLVASVFGGMMTWAWLRYWGDSVGCGFSSLIAGTIAYGVAIVLFDRKHLVSDLTILKTMLRPYKASPAM